MESIPEQLKLVAERLKEDQHAELVTVRTILSWFGGQKRGSNQTRKILRAFKKIRLTTEPDFREVYLDQEVHIKAFGDLSLPEPRKKASELHNEDGLDEIGPTIGTLPSASQGVVSVNRQAPVQEATALMMLHGFSQLPVMQGPRQVDGLISWKSIGQAMVKSDKNSNVNHFMEAPPTVLDYSNSLFDCISTIIEKEVVLVRGPEKTITGLVTTTDLSLKFRELSEAFLLLGKIESLIRRLINGCFTKKELQEAKDPNDQERKIESISDMTFGEYVRLLDNDVRWTKLNIQLDRKAVMERMKEVQRIRNEVMHFNPDGPDDADIVLLRNTEYFLTQVVR